MTDDLAPRGDDRRRRGRAGRAVRPFRAHGVARGDRRVVERLALPLGTVKSRMFAGLAKPRDALGETGSA